MIKRSTILLSIISLFCSGSDKGTISIPHMSKDGHAFEEVVKVQERHNTQKILITNFSGYSVIAYIKGFGVKDTDGVNEPYEWTPRRTTIASMGKVSMERIADTKHYQAGSLFPKSTVLYTLYASALVVRVQTANTYTDTDTLGDINTEGFFTNPFDASELYISSYQTAQGPRLKVRTEIADKDIKF